MAKSTGLDAGGYAVTVVELDGSFKKPRLTKVYRERLAPAGGDHSVDLEAELIADAAAAAVAEAGVPKDGLRMSFPCRNAVLRTLDVPFKGRETIRKVIKGEVEGAIHSYAVDDMVVDFYTVAEFEEGTRVITASAPKPTLRVQMMALERAGLEIEKIDLDAQALFRCAAWCGAFGEIPDEDEALDGAEPADGVVVATPAEALATTDPVRVVVDVGARAAKVLLVQGGVLREMRAIRLGSESVTDGLASSLGLAGETAHQAAWRCLVEGVDQEVEGLAEEDEAPLPLPLVDAGEEAETAVAPLGPKVIVTVGEVNKAVDRFRLRLERELQRFLTSTPVDGAIDAVWMTGGGTRWPGVDETLAKVFGASPRVLPVLDRLQHRLNEEEAAALERELAVAVGVALPGIGGPAGFNFRQEDLAFTKGFDRIKFPLAVCCMVGLFLMVVHTVKRRHDLKVLTHEYGETFYSDKTYDVGRFAGKPVYQYFGYVGFLVNDGAWFDQRDNYDRNDYIELLQELEEKPVFERLKHINNRISKVVKERQQDSGIFEDLQLPSGYAVLNRFAGILLPLEARLGRYQISELRLTLPPQENARRLTFTIVLRGDFRGKAADLTAAINDELARTESPFAFLIKTAIEGDQFRDEGEAGMYLDYELAIKQDYFPFPEASTN